MENILVTSYFMRLAVFFFCIPTGEREFWNRLPISLANIQTCLHLQKQFDISIYINHIYIYAYNMLLACTIYRFVPSKLATICRFSYQKKNKIHSSDFSGRWDWQRWCTHDKSTTTFIDHRRSKISIDCFFALTWALEHSKWPIFWHPEKWQKKQRNSFSVLARLGQVFARTKTKYFWPRPFCWGAPQFDQETPDTNNQHLNLP